MLLITNFPCVGKIEKQVLFSLKVMAIDNEGDWTSLPLAVRKEVQWWDEEQYDLHGFKQKYVPQKCLQKDRLTNSKVLSTTPCALYVMTLFFWNTFFSWDRVWCIPSQPSTSEPMMTLKYWSSSLHHQGDWVTGVCHQAQWVQRMKPKALCMLGRLSANWVISLATFEGFAQHLYFSYPPLNIPINDVFFTVEIFSQLPLAWWSCTSLIEVALKKILSTQL